MTRRQLQWRLWGVGLGAGFEGVGFGFDRQSNTPCCVTVVPGLNVKLTAAGGGTKLADTLNAELTVSPQVVAIPSVEQAPPQPPNVVGEVASSVNMTGVPLA